MSERGEMSPELHRAITDIVDKAYRSGRRDSGMSAVDYAVRLLTPLVVGIDENAHQRGRREMANEVDAMLSTARHEGGMPMCDWNTCYCNAAQLWRFIQESKGEIT